MGIIEDSHIVLRFIYDEYIDKNERVNPRKLLDKFEQEWEGKRIDRAIKYLRDIGAIEIILTMGNVDGVQNFIMRKLTPRGIEIVEEEL